MRISALIEAKGSRVVTIHKEATVREAIASLTEHRVGALVVSPDGSAIEGIVSERDVVQRLHVLGAPLLGEPVTTIMSAEVRTCSPADDTESLMAVMTALRVRHLPVVDGGRLAGIVSIGDVVKARIDELERDRAELVDYIHAR